MTTTTMFKRLKQQLIPILIVMTFATGNLLAQATPQNPWLSITLEEFRRHHITIFGSDDFIYSDEDKYRALYPANLPKTSLVRTTPGNSTQFPNDAVREVLYVLNEIDRYHAGFVMRVPDKFYIAIDPNQNVSDSATGTVGGRRHKEYFVGIGVGDAGNFASEEMDFILGHEVGHRVFEASIAEFLKEYLVGSRSGEINEALMNKIFMSLAGVMDIELLQEEQKKFDENTSAEIRQVNDQLIEILKDKKEKRFTPEKMNRIFAAIKKLKADDKILYLVDMVMLFTRGFNEVFADFFGMIVARDQSASEAAIRRINASGGMDVQQSIRSFDLVRAENEMINSGTEIVEHSNQNIPHIQLPRIRGLILQKFYTDQNTRMGQRTYDLFVADQLLRFAQTALIKILADGPKKFPSIGGAALQAQDFLSKGNLEMIVAQTLAEFKTELSSISTDEINLLFGQFRKEVIFASEQVHRDSRARADKLKSLFDSAWLEGVLNRWIKRNRDMTVVPDATSNLNAEIICADAMNSSAAESGASSAVIDPEINAPVSSNMPSPMNWNERVELARRMAESVRERVDVPAGPPQRRLVGRGSGR